MQSQATKGILFFLWVVAIACHGAPIVVQESVNSTAVIVGKVAPISIHTGLLLERSTRLDTGADGRLEIDLAAGLVRAGAKSSLRLDDNGDIELQNGAFLFDQAPRHIKIAADSRIIRGTGQAGFVRVQKEGADHSQGVTVAIGSLSRKLQILVGGKTHNIGPSELLILTGNGLVAREQFNLPKLIKTSQLVNSFSRPLPDVNAFVSAEHEFSSLSRRGFIRPHTSSLNRSGQVASGGPALLSDNRGHAFGSGGLEQTRDTSNSSGPSPIGFSEGIDVDSSADVGVHGHVGGLGIPGRHQGQPPHGVGDTRAPRSPKSPGHH